MMSATTGSRSRAGMTFTIEPGLYIRPAALENLPDTPENRAFIEKVKPAVERFKNIGVRIEDSFLLTDEGTREPVAEGTADGGRHRAGDGALSMRRLSGRTLAFLVVLAAAVPTALLVGQSAPKQGNPEDHLPPNITHLTWFGERASWSPDGRRIAFMSKSFGDAFEIDLATRAIRLLTHYPHPGFLRVQYLPNGDYFLIGARTFADIGTTRARDQEMWILPRDFKPGDRAVPLGHRISEGVAISRTSPKIAWSNTRGQYPDLLAEGESVIYTADVTVQNGQPSLTNKQEILRARAPECTLEVQDFRRSDAELIYTCYRGQFADVFGIDLASRRVTTYRKLAGGVQRGRGHLSRRRSHPGGVEPGAGAPRTRTTSICGSCASNRTAPISSA